MVFWIVIIFVSITFGATPTWQVRFVESFHVNRHGQRDSWADNGDAGDLWLVFHDEGTSLHDFMYSPLSSSSHQDEPHPSQGPEDGAGSQRSSEGSSSGSFLLLGPSQRWLDLRHSASGHGTIRSILRQLLLALASLHPLNITHRDVKPEVSATSEMLV